MAFEPMSPDGTTHTPGDRQPKPTVRQVVRPGIDEQRSGFHTDTRPIRGFKVALVAHAHRRGEAVTFGSAGTWRLGHRHHHRQFTAIVVRPIDPEQSATRTLLNTSARAFRHWWGVFLRRDALNWCTFDLARLAVWISNRCPRQRDRLTRVIDRLGENPR